MSEFPVTWERPEDALLSWRRDREHAPDPMRPLSGAFAQLVSHGFTTAFHHYSVPVKAYRMAVFNNYLYGSVELDDAPQEELDRLAKEAEGKLIGVMAELGSAWEHTYLPEIKALLDELASFDLSGASTEALLVHWDRMAGVQKRLYEIHFLILLPAMVAMSEFDELYRALFPSATAQDAYRLLQGFNNLTVETGRALWELSRKAIGSPEVRRVIEEVDESEVLDVLEASEDGRAFVADLRAYLDFYGQRGDKWDIAYPSWIEDPTPVITNLKSYARRDEHPAGSVEQLAADREAHVQAAREALKDNPMLPMFEFLLTAGQAGTVISEDHGFWIDFRAGYRLRRVCMEFGRRFAQAGAIEAADDVFFLYPDELVETAVSTIDRKPLVVQRRAELERWAAVAAPATIGADDVPLPADNPIARTFVKFNGGGLDPLASRDAIRGHPGAAGIARGRARIIRTIADADRLEPGDVLVAETTSPPWTPFFAIVSAVVTDVGGSLGHCAVVAREYGIPAVVGCETATDKIRDGQTIEVDGTDGIVRIVG